MEVFPESKLPPSPVGRREFVMTLLQGFPIYDDKGTPTGEYSAPLITKADARRLLAEDTYEERCLINMTLWGPDPFAAGWMSWYMRTPSMWVKPSMREWFASEFAD